MLDWQKLIDERADWVAHNFPDNELPKPQESILGLIEEIGELAHSHLKELQHIRGTDEEHQANAKDAIGDATIYLLGVLSDHRVVPYDEARFIKYTARRLDTPQSCIFLAARWAGNLGVKYGSSAARRTGSVVIALKTYCSLRGWNYEEIVMDTWNKVKQRDWIVDPVAGGE